MTSTLFQPVGRGRTSRPTGAPLWSGLLLVLSGCGTWVTSSTHHVRADEIASLIGRVDSGAIRYHGGFSDTFAIDVTEDGPADVKVCSDVRAEGGVLYLETEPGAPCDVSFEVRGAPRDIDTDIAVEHGTVELDDLAGTHRVEADHISARHLSGSAYLVSAEGMDIEIWPDAQGVVDLASERGDVVLSLPAGGSYDIVVVGDPRHQLHITDLGFDSLALDYGWFSGVSGDGSVTIRVRLSRGDFTLLEAK